MSLIQKCCHFRNPSRILGTSRLPSTSNILGGDFTAWSWLQRKAGVAWFCFGPNQTPIAKWRNILVGRYLVSNGVHIAYFAFANSSSFLTWVRFAYLSKSICSHGLIRPVRCPWFGPGRAGRSRRLVPYRQAYLSKSIYLNKLFDLLKYAHRFA